MSDPGSRYLLRLENISLRISEVILVSAHIQFFQNTDVEGKINSYQYVKYNLSSEDRLKQFSISYD